MPKYSGYSKKGMGKKATGRTPGKKGGKYQPTQNTGPGFPTYGLSKGNGSKKYKRPM